MRTTTVVFQFSPKDSQERLSYVAAEYSRNLHLSPILNNFASEHNISIDNLVSETVDHETCLRTVIRSWPDIVIATEWVNISLQSNSWLTDDYPGKIISAQVDPE
jgi:hypothetical protein